MRLWNERVKLECDILKERFPGGSDEFLIQKLNEESKHLLMMNVRNLRCFALTESQRLAGLCVAADGRTAGGHHVACLAQLQRE